MSEYKKRFIALLGKRQEIEKEQAEYFRKARELNDAINSNNNDIDLVFAEIQSQNYPLYSELFLDGQNAARAKFEHDGELIEIDRDLGYDNPVERIRIRKSKML